MITLNQVNELDLKLYVFNEQYKLFKCLIEDSKCMYEYTSEVIKICRLLQENHLEFTEDKEKNIKIIWFLYFLYFGQIQNQHFSYNQNLKNP